MGEANEKVPSCFVAQPFDEGKFDKRYRDVFEPAIIAGGAEPYRIDKDPSADVPIEEIERRITMSSLFFSDISIDNPNVWFEVGYAKAASKPMCVVCEKSQRHRLPFDVQHISVIFYSTESSSDFSELNVRIKERIEALVARQDVRQREGLISAGKKHAGLADHELSALSFIASKAGGIRSPTYGYPFREAMRSAGYTELASSLALSKLERTGYIVVDTGTTNHPFSDEPEEWESYMLTSDGWAWIEENQRHLNLKTTSEGTPF